MIFEPKAAKEFLISRIQSISNADGWKIEDVAAEHSEYILVAMTSAGSPDHVHGLVDGARVLANPSFLVLVYSKDDDEGTSLMKEIDGNLQNACGGVPNGYVKQVTRIDTLMDVENSATHKGKRYLNGAFYQCTVLSRQVTVSEEINLDPEGPEGIPL